MKPSDGFRQRLTRNDYGVERGAQVAFGAGVKRRDARVYGLVQSSSCALYLTLLQWNEVGPGRNGEVGLPVANERRLHGAVDALALERVQIDGRGRHQERGDHDAQKDADHETPICEQAS